MDIKKDRLIMIKKHNRLLIYILIVVLVATPIIYAGLCSEYHVRPIWDNHDYITPSLFNERFNTIVNESYYKNNDYAYVCGEVVKDYMTGGAGRMDVKDIGSGTGILVISYAMSDPLTWTVGDIVYLKIAIIENNSGYLVYDLDGWCYD